MKKNKRLNLKNEELIAEYKVTGCNEVLGEIIKNNLGIVHKCAFRVGRPNMRDDLIQEGIIGLMVAVDKFDVGKNVKFITYATWWVNQKIRRFCENNSRNIRVPVYLQEALKQECVVSESQLKEVSEKKSVNLEYLGKAFKLMQDTSTLESMFDGNYDNLAIDTVNEFTVLENRIYELLSEVEVFVVCSNFGALGFEKKTIQEIVNYLKENGLEAKVIPQMESASFIDRVRIMLDIALRKLSSDETILEYVS